MSIRTLKPTSIVVAIATVTLGLFSASGASAQNTIQKINKKVTHAVDKAGHATEYSVRKDVGQTSVATHKALGKNSVVRNNETKKNYVVHPGGTKTPEKKTSTAKK